MAQNRFAKYMTDGNLAYAPERRTEREEEVSRKKKKRVLPRTAVDVLPVAYVFVVAVSCLFILLGSTVFLRARTDLTIMTKQVSALQTELENKQQSNQDLLNEIAACSTLDVVRDKALKLGMKQANESQIIFYTSTEKDYVRQKDNIPNEK